jgi:hypothetical protein
MSSGRPILGCWELAFTSLPRLASIESVASHVYPMNRGSQAPELFHRWIVSVTPTALVVRDVVGTARDDSSRLGYDDSRTKLSRNRLRDMCRSRISQIDIEFVPPYRQTQAKERGTPPGGISGSGLKPGCHQALFHHAKSVVLSPEGKNARKLRKQRLCRDLRACGTQGRRAGNRGRNLWPPNPGFRIQPQMLF